LEKSIAEISATTNYKGIMKKNDLQSFLFPFVSRCTTKWKTKLQKHSSH